MTNIVKFETAPAKRVMVRVKNNAKKIRWHHHLLRGAVLAHVTHYVIVCRSIDADSASDIICGIFVLTEYFYALRDCSVEEKNKEETSEKVAA